MNYVIPRNEVVEAEVTRCQCLTSVETTHIQARQNIDPPLPLGGECVPRRRSYFARDSRNTRISGLKIFYEFVVEPSLYDCLIGLQIIYEGIAQDDSAVAGRAGRGLSEALGAYSI